MLSSLSSRLMPFLFLILALCAISHAPAQNQLLPVFHFNRLTTADGLPSNEVRAVATDRQGFIWIGTVNGLARYDGYGCRVYRNKPGDPHSLSSNAVMTLHVDGRGLLWIGTFDTGISLYDPRNDRFVNFLPRDGESTWLNRTPILSFHEDRSGNIWCGSDQSEAIMVDLSAAVNETDVDSISQHIRFRSFVFGPSSENVMWIGDWDERSILVATARGLFIVKRSGMVTSPLLLPTVSGLDLDTVKITGFAWETPQRLWISTSRYGLYLFKPASGALTAHPRIASDGKRIADDRISLVRLDQNKRLWIATTTGLNLFDPASGSYRDYLTLPPNRPGNTYFISLDGAGTLWVSTVGNGLYFLPRRSLRLPHYALRGNNGLPGTMKTIDKADSNSYWIATGGETIRLQIPGLTVRETIDLFRGQQSRVLRPDVQDSYSDGRAAIWYGTWGLGVYRFDRESGRTANFRPSAQGINLETGDDVCWSIAHGEGDSLWIAAYRDGLLQFNTVTGKFVDRSDVVGPHLSHVTNVMRDKAHRVWISDEAFGLFVLDQTTGTIEHPRHDPEGSSSISRDRPGYAYQDPQGRIWIGCDMVNLWVPETRSFKRFPNRAFGEVEAVRPLGTDARGNVWANYPGEGIGVLDPTTGTFTNAGISDGLCGNSVRAMCVLEDGRLLLTGLQGMNLVHSDGFFSPQPAPPLVFTRIWINDTLSLPAHGISSTQPLQLGFDQNTLEVEFAAIDPGRGDLIGYRYQLEGLEDAWMRPAGHRVVRYPGLQPGHYVFRVRATSIRGTWPEQEIALAIIIAPPWWRTWWAYGLYALFIVGMLFAGYRLRMRQVLLVQQAEMERFRAEHLADLNRSKSRFFANISHEFRTPLTLILGPLEKIGSRIADEDIQHTVGMMKRNARHLLRLINQLLDLSKLEAGEMKLRASRSDIVPVVKGVAYSFESSAGLRRMALSVSAQPERIEAYFDREKVEAMLINLISNAFKFTPPGGEVRVHVSRRDTPPPAHVEISVADTGSGIPGDKLSRIFDRFYQVDDSTTREQGGTGIGLALVKELAELHHGTISVTSRPGAGTEFTILLPLGGSHLKPDEIVNGTREREAASAIHEESDEVSVVEPMGERGPADQTPLVLIVEDNADVRYYIKDNLASQYRLLEAEDGIDGIEKAKETIPDLIISDVMMPKKDGYELCRTLKKDDKTSHIPIILLTAKAATESKIEGLETGADDYLIKPFEPKELLARVGNLIELRRKLRERFRIVFPLKADEVAVTSMDAAFLKKVMAGIEQHMGDDTFTVENLGSEVGLSRVQLHRKLTALTNRSPGEFMRTVRLHRAMELLQKDAGTVSEIAYSVGFSDPSYFSRCFHKEFGRVPTEIKKASVQSGKAGPGA